MVTTAYDNNRGSLKFYFRRHMTSLAARSTASRIHHRIEQCLCDFDKPLEEIANDSTTEQPMTAPLMEPDEVPPELTETRQRT